MAKRESTIYKKDEFKEEYETIIHEQKERIISLRDNNIKLSEKLKEFEVQKSAISGALLAAQKSADDIIENAKRQALGIISEAEKTKRSHEATSLYYKNSLKDLEYRCERILESIQNELVKKPQPALSIVETIK